MNLFEATQAHYAVRGRLLLLTGLHVARAVKWREFRRKWHTVLMVEAIVDVDAVIDKANAAWKKNMFDDLFVATWADSITTGDMEALKREGITVLALEREQAAEHV